MVEARLAWPEDDDYDLRVMQRSGIDDPYAAGLIYDRQPCVDIAV